MPFKVTIKDVHYDSIKKRVQEKLDAGYTLLKEITPVSKLRNDYNWKDKRGPKYSFAGNETITSYYAVVVKG